MAERRELSPPVDPFRQNLDLALKEIEAEPELIKREKLMQALENALAQADLPGAVEALQNGNQTEASRDLQLRLLRRWAGNDPPAAADWISRMPAGAARQEALHAVVMEWADQNLWQAVEWARGLPQSDERQSALLNAASVVARTAPTEALAVVAELPVSAARDNLITHAAMLWAVATPETAIAWAKQIADPPLRERVLAAIAIAWSESDPVAAANLAVHSLAPGGPQDDAIIGIVRWWAQTDPEAVTAWVSQFPEAQLREKAVAILATAPAK